MTHVSASTDRAAPYLYISPWVIGFIAFSGIPIIFSFVISLTQWNILSNPTWVGISNYLSLFASGSDFYKTLEATFIFTIVNVTATVLGSLGLAVLLNLKVRFSRFFEFVYFLPAVMPIVALAAVMTLIFDNNLGVANYVLSLFGINGPNWLGNSGGIWFVILLMSLFSFGTGQMMLIFNSGIKDVPQELLDVASIDGANAWQRFRHVTVPSISPLILFNVVVATVSSFNGAFTIIYPISDGGPGDATRVLSLDIYNEAFGGEFNLGTASAMAVVLFVIVVAISFAQFRVSTRFVNYE